MEGLTLVPSKRLTTLPSPSRRYGSRKAQKLPNGRPSAWRAQGVVRQGGSKKTQAWPVHIHLNNVSFSTQSPARPRSEAEKLRAQIGRLKPNYPWLYWPASVVFRVAVFILERIGFGLRLN